MELNNSLYRLPTGAAFSAWRRRTPEGFVMAVKMSRFLTHVEKLTNPGEPVERYLQRAARLGPRLGLALIQLPPRFEADPERFNETLVLFRGSVRVAVEFRDPSWFTDWVREILERHRAAFVLADSPRRRQPYWLTADWGFGRFHEGRAAPVLCCGETVLRSSRYRSTRWR